eukprot:2861530-Alexandrium_andersonii.AAC.1
MLDAAALQPWRRQPQWTARDMQLPALEPGAVPTITTRPELWHGAIFYRRPGAKGNDFRNYSLEPPEFLATGRLGKPGVVPRFNTAAYGNPGIWNEQQRFLTINGTNQAAF